MQVQEVTMPARAAVKRPDPAAIMQVGTGFWASKVLLSAVKLRLFTLLGERSLSADAIRRELELHPRSLYDFLDALVALGFLEREGLYGAAVYRNTTDTATFLDRTKPSYIGGMLEMCNDRLYPFWGTLEAGLKTGQPQNEIRYGGNNLFDAVYAEPDRLEQFMEAMVGIQLGAFRAFARSFDFSRYRSLADIGGATGALSIQVALQQPHLRCITFDLPAVEPVAQKWIAHYGVGDRVRVQSGDFFRDAFPEADMITMGNILHDWGYEDKEKLTRAAYDALPEGGAFVVIEGIIDDERRQNAFGLLMSLNMLIETPAGYDFTFGAFRELAGEVGFRSFELIHLAGPTSAAVAYK